MLLLHAQAYPDALRAYALDVLMNAAEVKLYPQAAQGATTLSAAQVENAAVTAELRKEMLAAPRISNMLHDSEDVFVTSVGGLYSFYAQAVQAAERRVETALEHWLQRAIAAITATRYAADKELLARVPRIGAAILELAVPPPADAEVWGASKKELGTSDAAYDKLMAATTAAVAELVGARAKPPFSGMEDLVATLAAEATSAAMALDTKLREHYAVVLHTVGEFSQQEQYSLIPAATQQLGVIWEDMLDAYRAQLDRVNSLEDLARSVAHEARRRLELSSDVLEAYRNTIPQLPITIEGAPKKRTLSAIMDTPAGHALMEWYHLFQPLLKAEKGGVPSLPFLSDATVRSFVDAKEPFEEALASPIYAVHSRLSQRSAIGKLTLGKHDPALDSAFAFLQAREHAVKTGTPIPEEFGAMETSTLDELIRRAADERASGRKKRGKYDWRGGGGGDDGGGPGGGGAPAEDKDVKEVAKHVEETRKQRDRAAVAKELALLATDADSAISSKRVAESAAKAATAAATKARAAAGGMSDANTNKPQAVADADAALLDAGEAHADAELAEQRADELKAKEEREEKAAKDAEKAARAGESEAEKLAREAQSAATKAADKARKTAADIESTFQKINQDYQTAQVMFPTATKAAEAIQTAQVDTPIREVESARDRIKSADKEMKRAAVAAEAATIHLSTLIRSVTDPAQRQRADEYLQQAQQMASQITASSMRTAELVDYARRSLDVVKQWRAATEKARRTAEEADAKARSQVEKTAAADAKAAQTTATQADKAAADLEKKRTTLVTTITNAAATAATGAAQAEGALRNAIQSFYMIRRNSTLADISPLVDAIRAQNTEALRASKTAQSEYATASSTIMARDLDDTLRADMQEYVQIAREAAQQAADTATEIGRILENVERWKRDLKGSQRAELAPVRPAAPSRDPIAERQAVLQRKAIEARALFGQYLREIADQSKNIETTIKSVDGELRRYTNASDLATVLGSLISLLTIYVNNREQTLNKLRALGPDIGDDIRDTYVNAISEINTGIIRENTQIDALKLQLAQYDAQAKEQQRAAEAMAKAAAKAAAKRL